MPQVRSISSREEFNLYNPAFVAIVESETARGHGERSPSGIPLPLVFAASTIALFSHLRKDLPSSKRTYFAKWVTDHPEFRPEFQRLMRGFTPPLRAGLIFALTHGVLRLQGLTVSALGQRQDLPASTSEETTEILDAARFVGRWFATAGTPSTTLSLLGFSA